jgi:hypothetical protein
VYPKATRDLILSFSSKFNGLAPFFFAIITSLSVVVVVFGCYFSSQALRVFLVVESKHRFATDRDLLIYPDVYLLAFLELSFVTSKQAEQQQRADPYCDRGHYEIA